MTKKKSVRVGINDLLVLVNALVFCAGNILIDFRFIDLLFFPGDNFFK